MKAIGAIRSLLGAVAYFLLVAVVVQLATGNAYEHRQTLLLMGGLFGAGLWFFSNLLFEGGVIRNFLVGHGLVRKQ